MGFSGGEIGSRWRVRFGGGITLPIANAYDADAGLLSSALVGLAMTGAWDPWLNTAASMAVVLRADFEYRHQYFLVGAETALGFNLPVEWHGRTGDTVVAPQLGIWAAGRPIEQLVLGLRFQAGFVEARWLINLDEPFGPAFDENRYWGFYIGGGAQF